jgi:hypothetical protein
MSLKLPGDTAVPAGCFHYMVPETGIRIPQGSNTSLYGCIAAVKEHYRANNLVVPSGLREKIEAACCKQAPPGQCLDDKGQPTLPTELPDVRGTAIDQVIQGTRIMATWITEGKVDEGLAQARATVCAGCKFNQDSAQGCPSCRRGMLNVLKDVVVAALSRQALPWEESLKSCGICGCALKLKVWCLHSAIVKHTKENQLRAFPDWCWVRTEMKTEQTP